MMKMTSVTIETNNETTKQQNNKTTTLITAVTPAPTTSFNLTKKQDY